MNFVNCLLKQIKFGNINDFKTVSVLKFQNCLCFKRFNLILETYPNFYCYILFLYACYILFYSFANFIIYYRFSEVFCLFLIIQKISCLRRVIHGKFERFRCFCKFLPESLGFYIDSIWIMLLSESQCSSNFQFWWFMKVYVLEGFCT